MRLFAAIAVAVGVCATEPAAFAASAAQPNPAAGAAVDTCQEQFLLDRRDDPRNALKSFHRCNAVHDVSLSMEKFTFWYITLPTHARENGSWFANEWRNDLAVLESPFVGLKQKEATDLLDKSIVHGLQRGKRDGLAQNWLKSHNPHLLAGASAAEAHEAAATKEPAAALAGTSGPAAPVAAEDHAAGRRISHAERRRYRVHRRYARADGASGSGMPSEEQLNRAELRADMAESPAMRFSPAPYPVAGPVYVPLPPYYPLPAPTAPVLQAPVFRQSQNDPGALIGAIADNLRSTARALFGPVQHY